jgi:hypothetical protein
MYIRGFFGRLALSAQRPVNGEKINSENIQSHGSGDVAERPLSFAADMVRAVQAGIKRQTRRPMYPQPERVIADRFYRGDGREIICPFGVPGDRLWVRERFAQTEDGTIVYAADPVKGRSRLTWQQSRYLPREASRLTLLVRGTRPQRLQEISEADARAEGYDQARETRSPIEWFARLWDRLSVTESLRWAANPWLWVVEFDAPEANAIPVVTAAAVVQEKSDRTPRMATMEERQRLAEVLRSRAR